MDLVALKVFLYFVKVFFGTMFGLKVLQNLCEDRIFDCFCSGQVRFDFKLLKIAFALFDREDQLVISVFKSLLIFLDGV